MNLVSLGVNARWTVGFYMHVRVASFVVLHWKHAKIYQTFIKLCSTTLTYVLSRCELSYRRLRCIFYKIFDKVQF